MDTLRWMRRAREGEAGIAEVRDRLHDEEDAEAARPLALALSRAGAVSALGVVLQSGGAAARVAALEALETVSSVEAGMVALRGHDEEPDAWLRRRRVALAVSRGVEVEDAWNAEDPGVCAVLLAADVVDDQHVEYALERAAAGSGRLWDEVAWWACVRAGGELGVASLLEAAGEHPNVFVVAQAARALRALGLAPAFDVEGLWREDVPLDLEGVRALDDQVPADVERAVIALRLARERDALLAAVGRLAGSALEPATTALVDGTTHPRPEVRAAAVRGLDGRTGPAVWAAYDAWVRQEPDPERRVSVVWTVARRREAQALDALLPWVDVEDRGVRLAVAEGLSERVRKRRRDRTGAARAALERLVAQADPVVTAAAQRGLARFG